MLKPFATVWGWFRYRAVCKLALVLAFERRRKMRPLEWLLLLAFMPVLLLPFIPLAWRRYWLFIAAPLPVMVGILHIGVEGWRSQMLPLYGFAILVFISRLPALQGRDGILRRSRGVFISGVSALLLIGGGVLAGWLLPVLNLPVSTGMYSVGIVDRELVDEVRGRRLMVSVWYPAAQSGTSAPLTHYPDEVMNGLANLTGLPAPLFQHLRYSTVEASEGVPVLAENTPFPVLVFSHGMVGLRLQNSSTLQELASWGYVVVAIDHTDAAAVTVFPDGEARYYDLARFGVPAGDEVDKALMNEYVFPVWVADQRFIYDTLETWQVNDPLLAGKLDLTRVGSFGHSFGGATALEVCRVDTRCQAAVNMDGALYGETATLPAVRPLLLMTSADSAQYADTVAEWTQMTTNATDAAYWLELPNSSHLSFTITQLLSPLLVPDGFEPRAGLQVIDTYLRAFFDSQLRGLDAPLINPISDPRDVHWLANNTQED
jgi:predicted dienelactone hydrolase